MNEPTPLEVWNVVINAIVAAGTILVAILAIWGDAVRHWLASPKLTIEPYRDFKGDVLETTSGRKMVFYFLLVRNSRRWATAKNVRVLLKRFERRGPDNRFHEEASTIPFQFCWTPSELSEAVQTFVAERRLDLGFLWEWDDAGQSHFEPKLYGHPTSNPYFVRSGQAVRYHLQIVGENFHCPETTVIEVAWDGRFTENIDELRTHLRISVVKTERVGPTSRKT